MTDYINKTNPEAGFMPEPTDPREAEACFRASTKSIQAFPYFVIRFGERGKRFTYSDSGFIVSLITRPQDVVIAQIKWLGKMLSNRGIPQYLLERHLEFLTDELESEITEKRNEIKKLRITTELLRSERTKIFPDTIMHDLNQNFLIEIGSELSQQMHGCGLIIISAVADQKMDVKNSVRSVFGWMTDSSRFPREWIIPVQNLFQNANYYANQI